jgi:hypothetical protein
MPAYYFNYRAPLYSFFSEETSIEIALSLAGPVQTVRLLSYTGYDMLTGRRKNIFKDKAHSSLKAARTWVIPESMTRILMDQHLRTQEYALEFSNDIMVNSKESTGTLITYTKEHTEKIFEAYGLPVSARALLLAQPDTLFYISKATGEHQVLGHYKDIKLLFNPRIHDKAIHFAKPNVRLN